MPSTLQSSYSVIRWSIRPGDSLAFVGRRGIYSWLIRTFTGRPTHVAPVAWIEDSQGEPRVVLVEAVEGKGVVWSYASERVGEYDGNVYLMRLDPNISRGEKGIGEWLKDRIGIGYSMLEAVLSAPGQWFRIPGKDRGKALFCSELDWRSKVEGGSISVTWMGDDETPTPNQLKNLPIWLEFIQIKGVAEPL